MPRPSKSCFCTRRRNQSRIVRQICVGTGVHIGTAAIYLPHRARDSGSKGYAHQPENSLRAARISRRKSSNSDHRGEGGNLLTAPVRAPRQRSSQSESSAANYSASYLLTSTRGATNRRPFSLHISAGATARRRGVSRLRRVVEKYFYHAGGTARRQQRL